MIPITTVRGPFLYFALFVLLYDVLQNIKKWKNSIFWKKNRPGVGSDLKLMGKKITTIQNSISPILDLRKLYEKIAG